MQELDLTANRLRELDPQILALSGGMIPPRPLPGQKTSWCYVSFPAASLPRIGAPLDRFAACQQPLCLAHDRAAVAEPAAEPADGRGADLIPALRARPAGARTPRQPADGGRASLWYKIKAGMSDVALLASRSIALLAR